MCWLLMSHESSLEESSCTDVYVLLSYGHRQRMLFCVCAEKLHLISSNRILLQRVIINFWEEGKWWYLGKAADGTVMCRLSFPRHAISLIVY